MKSKKKKNVKRESVKEEEVESIDSVVAEKLEASTEENADVKEQ